MRILIDRETIQKRVAALGRELTEIYKDKPLTVICLLNGAMIFASDLLRTIELPLQYDTFAASSYENTRSTGELKIRSDLKLDISNRHVLIVDDILDTGLTMKCITERFMRSGALSVKSCVLLNKKVNGKLFISPDHVGFEIENEFVVGYGLDCDEEYRNLPYIGVLN